MITIDQLAGEAYDAFTTVERGDETIVTLKDDQRDGWIRDMVYEAHGDFMPDDWRYQTIRHVLSDIADSGRDDPDSVDDLSGEICDSVVDVYTGARLQWLASNLNRPGYCDQAQEEGLAGEEADVVTLAGMGQYMEAQEIFYSVVQSLKDELEAREEDDEAE